MVGTITHRITSRVAVTLCGLGLGLAVALAPVRTAQAADPSRYAEIETEIDSAIGAFMDAATELGSRAQSGIDALTAAKASVEDAAADDAAGDTQGASKALRKAGRRVRGLGFKLRNLRARKTIPAEVREPLAAMVREIEQDIRALRKDL